MKKIHIICAYLLAFLFFVAGCKTLAKMQEPQALAFSWREYYRGHYEIAIRTFEEVLKYNPQSANANMGLAITWEDLGDYGKAKEYFSKAVDLDPRSRFLFYDIGSNEIESADIRRGWRERGKARYDGAITSFNLALQKNPKSAEAYFGLAVVWLYKKDDDKAMEYLSKAIEIEPRAKDKAGYFFLRGDEWLKNNNVERAIEDNTSAISTDPTFLAPYVSRAYCYRKIGKLEAAVADYNKVLELIPADDQSPYAVGARKIALEAISDLQKKLRKT